MSLAGVAAGAHRRPRVVGRSLRRPELVPLGIFFGALAGLGAPVRVLGLPAVHPARRRVAIAERLVTYLPGALVVGDLHPGRDPARAGHRLRRPASLAGVVTARWVGLREIDPAVRRSRLNSIPIIAFAPIINNWFGLDKQLSKAMIAAVLCFFPVMINTVRGLLQRSIPRPSS